MFINADLETARRISFDLTTLPIVLAEGRTGIVRAANPAFLSLVGLSQDRVVGRSLVELGLWKDEGQRNSFLSCLAIEGSLSRYPLAYSFGVRDAFIYVGADPVRIDDELMHLLRFDVVSESGM